jgi:putative chitinase
MQITGRANYAACSEALFQLDLLLRYPPLLETALVASLSAAWFWRARGLNELADLGNFERITRRINGGLNGQAQRLQFWVRAKSVLAAGDQP